MERYEEVYFQTLGQDGGVKKKVAFGVRWKCRKMLFTGFGG